MAPKRRRSFTSPGPVPPSKRTRVQKSTPPIHDHFSNLSDELSIRILHLLPLPTLLRSQLISHRFYQLTSDSQLWKNLYYERFVLPRALRIPGIKNAPSREEALVFSSRRSRWLDEEGLVNRDDGKRTDWKGRYRLRHNWSRGACEVREIRVKEERSSGMLVKMAEGMVVTAAEGDGLRAWNLRGKGLLAQFELGNVVPTSLAVDEQDGSGLGVAVGFRDGGWRTWKLNAEQEKFVEVYTHPASSNGTLSAVAYAYPYLLTITQQQLLSLYSFLPPTESELPKDHTSTTGNGLMHEEQVLDEVETPVVGLQSESESSNLPAQPRLLASLKSHTSWPPLSLSIRTTPTTLIASIAYTLRTYTSGYTVGLQELHLSRAEGEVIFSRLTSALPQGFTSILAPALPSSSPERPTTRISTIESSRPTTLSYSHPYILATHPDNTLTLYLCNSTASDLSITPGTKLWGHTSSVSSAEITPRGKAVSVSTRGNELRVWELEGGFKNSSSGFSAALTKRGRLAIQRSVRVRPGSRSEVAEKETQVSEKAHDNFEAEIGASKRWVGFDDEVVIVLKESGMAGRQALVVYDFT